MDEDKNKRKLKGAKAKKRVSTPLKGGFSLFDARASRDQDEGESDSDSDESRSETTRHSDVKSKLDFEAEVKQEADLLHFDSDNESTLFKSAETSLTMVEHDTTTTPPTNTTTSSVPARTSGDGTGTTGVTSTVYSTSNPRTSSNLYPSLTGEDITIQQLGSLFSGMGQDTFDLRRQKLELEAASKAKADEFLKNIKQSWVAIDQMSQTNPDFYRESKNLLQKLMEQWNVTLVKPTLVDEMRALAKEHKTDSKGVVSKVAHRIPMFTGTDPNYSWEMFRLKLNIVATNASYQDYEMKTILFQTLDGNALQHFHAHESEYLTLTYQQLLEKFNERYGIKLQKVIDTLMNSPQASNEDVRSYCDKLKNLAKPLLPPVVPQRKIIYGEQGEEEFIKNPFYEEELKDFQNKQQQHEMYLIRFFINGLRDEIIQRMQKVKFDRLDEAMQMAIDAEDYLDSVKQIRTHNLRVENPPDTPAVNAVTTNPLPEMDKRGASFSRSKSRDRDSKKSRCHNCNQPGHWKNECPLFKKQASSNSAYRSSRYDRSTDRSNSRSRYYRSDSPGRRSSQGSSVYQFVGDLSRRVDQLAERFGRTRFRSRSHSRGRRENRSRSRHSNRSRSRSFSRSRSRPRYQSRSQSRERPGRYHSRSNSRSRDASRSPHRNSNREQTKNVRSW
jgi:hypothetical protein